MSRQPAEVAFTIWEAGPDGIQPLVVTHSMSAAYDILHDAEVPPSTIEMIVLGSITTGRDPETMARKFLSLRRAARPD